MREENRRANAKNFEENKTKLFIGVCEFCYFTFCAVMPTIWPQTLTPGCAMNFQATTIGYCVVLAIMIPTRIFF